MTEHSLTAKYIPQAVKDLESRGAVLRVEDDRLVVHNSSTLSGFERAATAFVKAREPAVVAYLRSLQSQERKAPA